MKKILLALSLFVSVSLASPNQIDASTTKKVAGTITGFPMLTTNEISCLSGTYKGYWNGQTIILEIVDAVNVYDILCSTRRYIAIDVGPGAVHPLTDAVRGYIADGVIRPVGPRRLIFPHEPSILQELQFVRPSRKHGASRQCSRYASDLDFHSYPPVFS